MSRSLSSRRRPADEGEIAGLGRGPLLLSLLFGLSLLLAVLGHLTGVDALALAGVIGALVFGVGAAPLQLIEDMDLAARLGISALIGFSVLVGVGALMADLRPLWHPDVAAVLFGGAAGVLHLLGLLRSLPRAAPSLRLSARSATTTVAAHLRRRPSVALVLSLLGTALWLGTAIATPHIDPGIGGLLTKMSPLWFAGIVLVLASIAYPQRDERLLAFSVLSLALATTLTPALVYGAPRSQSAAKQIDYVLLILRQHHIAPGSGIYEAYSSFFAGNAWLCRIAGVSSPVGLATYWPVLLAFVRVAELRFLAGRSLTFARARWLAVTLVILVDCIGADYFSPQSLGYVMALGMFALVVKGVTPRPLGTRSLFAVLALASLALGPTHELSPYIIAGVFAVLAVFGEAPYWTPVVAALPAFEWASLEHKVVGQAFSFSQIFSVSNFAPPKTVANPGLQRMAIVGISSDALLGGLLILILAAAIGLLCNLRSRRVWAYALCPIVGLFFVAINPYGNEGIFRTALFGIPWLALAAVEARVPPRGRWRARLPARGARRARLPPRGGWRNRLPALSALPARRALPAVGLLALFVTLLATFMIGAYGMDGSDVMRLTDFQAADTFNRQAPPRSFLLAVGYGDYPGEGPTPGYDVGSLLWQQVVRQSLLTPGHPQPSDLPLLTRLYRQAALRNGAARSSRLYILWSRSLLLYSEEYGLQSAAQTRGWLHLLLVSPAWQPIFHHGDTYLFRLRTPAGAPSVRSG